MDYEWYDVWWYNLCNTWDWIWPEYFLPILLLCFVLGALFRLLHIANSGFSAFRGDRSVPFIVAPFQAILKSAAKAAALGVFIMVVLLAVSFFQHEDVTEHRGLWIEQLEKPFQIIDGLIHDRREPVLPTPFVSPAQPDTISLGNTMAAIKDGIKETKEEFQVKTKKYPNWWRFGIITWLTIGLCFFLYRRMGSKWRAAILVFGVLVIIVVTAWPLFNGDATPPSVPAPTVQPLADEGVNVNWWFLAALALTIFVISRSRKWSVVGRWFARRWTSFRALAYETVQVLPNVSDTDAGSLLPVPVKFEERATLRGRLKQLGVILGVLLIILVANWFFFSGGDSITSVISSSTALQGQSDNDTSVRWWIDVFFWMSVVVFFWQVFDPREKIYILYSWNKYVGGIVAALYIMLYLTLRPWITLGQGFGLFVLVNLIQFIVVTVLVILSYRKFMWMWVNKQCMVTVDPETKEPKKFAGYDRFFGLGLVTFVVFTACFLVLFSFPLDIIKVGGVFSIRIGMLIATLIVVGVVWAFSRHKKVIKYLDNRKIDSRAILFPGAILCVLALVLPGAWIFCFLLFIMLAAWKLAGMFMVPIANKVVPEIGSKDRYWSWLYFFARDKKEEDKIKRVMRDGFHATFWAVWGPFTRYYVFEEEILEVDKYPLEEELSTSSVPCKFEKQTIDGQEYWVEIPTTHQFDSDDENSDVPTGPQVGFFVNQRFEKYADPAAYLRRDKTDRTNPQGLIKRSTQNVMRRLTRKLSMNQALNGGYYVSDRHLFFFGGINYPEGHEKAGDPMPVTFRWALRRECMLAVGFYETDTETSDANIHEDLRKLVRDVEGAKLELEKAKIDADRILVEEGAEGAGLASKIGHVEKALETGHFGREAYEGLQAMEFAANSGTVYFAPGLVNRVAAVASQLTAAVAAGNPVVPTPASEASDADTDQQSE